MPKQKKNHSEELYEWLNVKFHPVEMLNADGEETSDYDEVTTFVFEYRDDQGTSENVKVSLTDNDRKLDSDVVSKVTVEYDQDMANQINTGFSKFLTELREWARGRMLGFQVTNVETEPGKRTVQESKFSALSGTVKTSVQTLENVKIILKHTDVINDDVRGARTRKIHRIYVENAQGERFLMPFTSLRGARAMARHVAQGGNPYDATGSGISNSVAEAVSLSKFLRRTNGKQYEDVTAVGMIESARLRLAEVKKMLNGLSGVKGYSRYSSAIAERTQIEYNPEVKNHFVRNQYDEQLDNSLPYVWRAYQMSNLKEFDEFAQWTDGVVNEVDDAANPKVQAVQKLIGQQPEKPNEPKTNVQLTPKGTVAIELGKGDKPGAARVAELIRSGKMPPGTSIVAMQEGQMQQFEATFEKNGKTVTKTISAVSQGSAEIQAYHMADATGSEIVGDVKPVSEGLGGDGDDADDLMTDVMKPGQEMYETGNKRISYDDTQLAQRVIDLHQRGESLSDLLDRFPQLQSMIDDIVVDYHYHPDDDHEEIQAQLIDNLEDIVKHGSRKSSADLAEADMEEGNEWTGARRAAIKAGEEHFTVGGKTYPVTGGDTSDEQKMTEGLNRILFLSGVRK